MTPSSETNVLMARVLIGSPGCRWLSPHTTRRREKLIGRAAAEAERREQLSSRKRGDLGDLPALEAQHVDRQRAVLGLTRRPQVVGNGRLAVRAREDGSQRAE